ncbi:MAG: hypothetical protein M0D57_00770 [Sphingobacteriales bacterium JAD_PAG50586_3]|nr:MAG: hypothetical protein M0D57_00770 [Sphingobacteriales bacterium JAD_PAG50586_3]
MKTIKKYSAMKTLIAAFMLLSVATFAQQGSPAAASLASSIVREDVPSTANLDKFTATYTDGVVKLNWILSKQDAQAKLIIEKSADGVNYSYMGKLPAVASPNKITYSCRDNSPADGSNFYRIKAVNSTNTEFIYDDTAHVNTKEPVQKPKVVTPLASYTPETPENPDNE